MLSIALLTGCGSDGPARYVVEGSVSYQGRPVPAGRIVFEPDRSKGNKGPAAYADIKDGHYATLRDKGHVGGPHVARISGNDGVASGEQPDGAQLFPDHTEPVDLPQETTTIDFTVPTP